MTQKCCICKDKVVSHWIPADPGIAGTVHYPVCSSEHCKYMGWTLPSNHSLRRIGTTGLVSTKQ